MRPCLFLTLFFALPVVAQEPIGAWCWDPSPGAGVQIDYTIVEFSDGAASLAKTRLYSSGKSPAGTTTSLDKRGDGRYYSDNGRDRYIINGSGNLMLFDGGGHTNTVSVGGCPSTPLVEFQAPLPANTQPEPVSEYSNKLSYKRFFTVDELKLCAFYYNAGSESELDRIKQELVGGELVDDTYINWLTISANYVRVGMNRCELFATLGRKNPDSRTRSTLGTTELYIYGDRWVYFQDGEVSSIHE